MWRRRSPVINIILRGMIKGWWYRYQSRQTNTVVMFFQYYICKFPLFSTKYMIKKDNKWTVLKKKPTFRYRKCHFTYYNPMTRQKEKPKLTFFLLLLLFKIFIKEKNIMVQQLLLLLRLKILLKKNNKYYVTTTSEIRHYNCMSYILCNYTLYQNAVFWLVGERVVLIIKP